MAKADREKKVAVLGARKLAVRIAPASESDLDNARYGAAFNRYLKAVTVQGTDKQLIIDFDVDTGGWLPVNACFPLLVRVFDKDGEHLTHFGTTERFTGDWQVHAGWEKTMNRLKDLPEDQRKQLDYFPPVLLKSTGNRLIYPVAERYLKDAAIVEIGFRRP